MKANDTLIEVLDYYNYQEFTDERFNKLKSVLDNTLVGDVLKDKLCDILMQCLFNRNRTKGRDGRTEVEATLLKYKELLKTATMEVRSIFYFGLLLVQVGYFGGELVDLYKVADRRTATKYHCFFNLDEVFYARAVDRITLFYEN